MNIGIPIRFANTHTISSHLLGKKSWNVYNADNIARVRRDEAEAKAKEEAEEQRMQDHDAKRRLAILRGEVPPPYEEPKSAAVDGGLSRVSEQAGLGYGGYKERKKRKRAGEDDTDFELRVARERAPRDEGLRKTTMSSSAPLVGRDGHIDLIGDEKAYRHAEKNPEAEKEAAHLRREYEDQFRMRLSNAAGNKNELGKNPWYTSTDAKIEVEPPSKDVWGNEDPLRKQREAARLVSNDPLAMMKAGAAKVREVRRARESAQLEREEELRKLEKEQRRRERHVRREERRHRHHGEERHRSRERRRKRERSSGPGRGHDAESRRRRRSSSPRRDRGHRDDRRDERGQTERRRD